MFAREETKQGDVAIAPLVYLVDDDEDFREEMVFGLSRLGLNVQGFGSAAALYRAYAALPSEIVILDLNLGDEDGLSMAAHLRASQPIGIIMATAKGSIDDRLAGLEKGADAYLVKPIDIRELAATVMAVHNRVNRHCKVPAPPQIPQWALVEGGWTLTDGMGHRLRLTVSEQHLLGCLFRARGSTVVRSALVEAMGADVYDFNYTHLDTIVSRLRRRAEKSNMLLPLHAIRGQGFIFAE
ncbi:response regulator transcription factor [Labrys sp. ZIDIC5]|uniref:response regulator transcription factor n=1 Tax=Labrys sedimenti TaxID=3106036 RepID=UPI002ACA7D93|nr:response regulator transcription factor [Labrys sp. ZIDIC5]MDZ5452229.1 response regulator transcription factor [Labrys sp. ZIDIC5]